MTIELARRRLIAKAWGAHDLGPWAQGAGDGSRVGEVWYERSTSDAPATTLLLKLLFTTAQLSIQVHPDDAQARAKGLASGKTEAWYILHADPGAQVALGLRRTVTARHLREAAEDGSLSKLILWRSVFAGDTVFVPAGTIHSISAGLVIAEIQQCCDTTFRLLDPGLNRELHIDQAVEVARPDLPPEQRRPRHINNERTLLALDSHFILERLSLPAASEWSLKADRETWLFVLSGSGRADPYDVGAGSVVFASADRVALTAGAQPLICLVAYAGGERPEPHLLQSAAMSAPAHTEQPSMPKSPALVPTIRNASATRLVRDIS